MKIQKRWRELFFSLLFAGLTVWLVTTAADILRPKQTVYGSTWNAFLAEPADSLDVIWAGSSYCYCDVDPTAVYRSSGLTGYVMAGGEQPLGLTYWYLREIFRTQSPSVVMLEGTSMFFKPVQNYTEQNIVQMPMTVNRLGAILTSAEPELRQELLFDLSLYHGRWRELSAQDVVLGLTEQSSDYKGFTPMKAASLSAGDEPYVGDRQVSSEDYAANLAWLEKIAALCREHGARLVVAIHPTYSRCTPETYARIGEELHRMDPAAVFRDWSAEFDSIGLIPEEHMYDVGHLNQAGAARFSAWLGQYLTQELGIVPRTQTEENTLAWDMAAERAQQRAAQ